MGFTRLYKMRIAQEKTDISTEDITQKSKKANNLDGRTAVEVKSVIFDFVL